MSNLFQIHPLLDGSSLQSMSKEACNRARRPRQAWNKFCRSCKRARLPCWIRTNANMPTRKVRSLALVLVR